MINEAITKSDQSRYIITGIESVDDATWEIALQKQDG